MLTESDFRQSLPEFTSTIDYPSAQVQFYLTLGIKMLPADRWGDCLDQGLTLYIAHYLVLYARAKMASSLAGAAGVGRVVGLETSKSVDKVSVSSDVASVSLADAGHWNQTTYGIQFFQLAMMFGAGGYQL